MRHSSCMQTHPIAIQQDDGRVTLELNSVFDKLVNRRRWVVER